MYVFNDAVSQLQNTVKFMGRPIEYVDSTDLLGVSVTSRIRERNVNSSVQKFYCWVKADQLDSLKKFCILSENVIFHE